MEEKSTLKRSTIIVAICLVIIMIVGFINLAAITNSGTHIVRQVRISPYGADLSASIMIPRSALETDGAGNFVRTYPAVIVNAGFTNSRTFGDNTAIELVRSGFVVFHIDMYGHGHSEAIDFRGFGPRPSPVAPSVRYTGAYDALAYLRTLGFVDQTRIGAVGHSLGGGAVSRLAAGSSGFLTLQDQLLDMLYEEFDVEITEADVAAQNANAVAVAALNSYQLAHYRFLEAQITYEFNRAVRNVMIYDATPRGVDPTVVYVAGIPVWRDAQLNFGYLRNISGAVSGGLRNRDHHLASDLTLMMLAQESPVQRDTWYGLNLSGTDERVLSTPLGAFHGEVTPAIREAAANNSLRKLTTPWGWHGFTYISTETARDAAHFFRVVLEHDNGVQIRGTSWIFRDIMSAVGLVTFFVMIMPLASIIMKIPFFASMKGEPREAAYSKKTPIFWIFMVICVALPFFTYPRGVGWAEFLPPGPLNTLQVTTQIVVWGIVLTGVYLALIIIKYFAYDKRKLGVGFLELYGLKYSCKNIGKSALFALVMFALISILLTVLFYLFGGAVLKITPIGSMIFQALGRTQYYHWALYAIYFLPFMIVNSMIVNSSRLQGMGERKNMVLIALINAAGIFLLSNIQYKLGHLPAGATVFPIAPGSGSSQYAMSIIWIMLLVSAMFARKMYIKTGSAIPGAFLNAAIFTIPAIQVFSHHSFF